jgi:hypothetical protein
MTAASATPQPCKWCGRLMSRPIRRRQHEARCNANPAARWSIDGERPTTKNAYNTWQKAQAEDRIRRLFAQVDLTAEPVEVQRQMMALGIPSAGAARHLIRRGMRMGVVPMNLRRRLGENRVRDSERFNEYIREFFKDVRLDRPLAPQLRERGGKPTQARQMSERARQLGLIPVDFRFPSHEPADLRRPPKPKKPRQPSQRKAAPKAATRPSGSVAEPRQRPSTDKGRRELAVISALDGDAVRPRCPNAGCDWEGNTFRLRRHLNECPYRDKEDE